MAIDSVASRLGPIFTTLSRKAASRGSDNATPTTPSLVDGWGLERLEENPPENTDVWWFFGKLKEKNIKDSNKFWTNLCKHAPLKLMKTIWKPWHAPGPGRGLIKINTCLAETLSTPGGLSGQAVQTHGGFARPSTCQQGFGLPTVESAKWYEYIPSRLSIQIHMPRYWYADAMYMQWNAHAVFMPKALWKAHECYYYIEQRNIPSITHCLPL